MAGPEQETIDRALADVADVEKRMQLLLEASRELELARQAKARSVWEKRDGAYGTSQELAEAIKLLELSVTASRASLTREDLAAAAAEPNRDPDEARRLAEILKAERSTDHDQERNE